MAIKISYTTTSYSCPSCKKIIKTTEEGREFIVWLFFLMSLTIGSMPIMDPETFDYIYMLSFIPALLIGFGLFGVYKLFRKHTIAGKEVITCRKCKNKVVIDQVGTRLLVTHENLLNRVLVDLKQIEAAQIKYEKSNQNYKEYSEQIDLKFVNKTNHKTLVVSLQVSSSIWFFSKVHIKGDTIDYIPGNLYKIVTDILS